MSEIEDQPCGCQREQTDSKNPIANPNQSNQLDSLSGFISDEGIGEIFPLLPSYADGLNFLKGIFSVKPGSRLTLGVGVTAFPACASSLTVLDGASIYVADAMSGFELRNPTSVSNPNDLNFMVYPSQLTKAIRATMSLSYKGKTSSGQEVLGEIGINPMYQQDTTSYLLRVDGKTFTLTFSFKDYQAAWSGAVSASNGGKVSVVVRVTQLDSTLYNFYSTANGFNDPSTMRTEKPVYTNIIGGLGFFASASYEFRFLGIDLTSQLMLINIYNRKNVFYINNVDGSVEYSLPFTLNLSLKWKL